MASIGILGGMGPQASSLLLDLLIQNAHRFTDIQSDEDFPDILLLNVPVPNFTTNQENQQKALNILLSKLPVLEQANTTVNALACNTAHILLPEIQDNTNLKFIHMPNLVIAEAKRLGCKRVGLLGSQTTVNSDIYNSDDLTLVKPNFRQQNTINNLIMKQIRGDIKSSDKKQLQTLVNKFLDDQSLDAVILGCTELPVIIDDHPKTISSLHVLADEALKRYYM